MWEARISLPDGKRKSHYAKTRKEADDWLTEAKQHRNKGLPIVLDERTPLADYLCDWLQTMQTQLRPRTYTRYEETVRLHLLPTLGKTPLARLQPAQVQALYREKLAAGQSAGSVARLHAVLHKALADALRLGLVQRNVASLAQAPSARRGGSKRAQALTPEQARTFVEAVAGHPLEAFFLLGLTTGMRRGEMLGLRWRDVDLDQGWAEVRQTVQHVNGGGYVFQAPKTERSRRKVPLGALVAAALHHHRVRQNEERLAVGRAWVDEDLIFTDAIGCPLNGNSILRRQFQPLLKAAGLPAIRLHDLRHTAATLAAEAGAPIGNVSDMLGHSSAAMTLDTYRHAFESSAGVAVAAIESTLLGTAGRHPGATRTAE
jgi:integrase